MLDNPFILRRGDPDFPTTKALQDHLVPQARVEG